jgi:hypothetical protein
MMINYLHALDFLKESVRHSTTNDHLIDFVQQIFNELDFVSDFSASKNGKEWSAEIYKLKKNHFNQVLNITFQGCQEPWQSS